MFSGEKGKEIKEANDLLWGKEAGFVWRKVRKEKEAKYLVKGRMQAIFCREEGKERNAGKDVL